MMIVMTPTAPRIGYLIQPASMKETRIIVHMIRTIIRKSIIVMGVSTRITSTK